MIDYEADIFDVVEKALLEGYPDIQIEPSVRPQVGNFPAVLFYEMDNSNWKRTQTQRLDDQFALITYEVQVFSNKVTGGKAEVKSILAVIDGEMLKMGFTRLSNVPVNNLADPSVSRRVARYEAVIDAAGTIYRRN